VAGTKVAVPLRTGVPISVASLRELSEKEFALTSSDEKYTRFRAELHNPEVFDTVIRESILLTNQIHNPLLPNAALDRKYEDFAIRFIYESNKTEGSKIPLEAVKNIIEQKRYAYKVANEIREVENSLKTWRFIHERFVFNVANIKKVYHTLTAGLLQENGQKYPRGFKKVPIVVNNSATSAPETIEADIR